VIATLLIVGVVLASVPLTSYRDSASSSGVFRAGSGTAYAEEAWKREFDDICSQTEASGTLTKEQLRDLIARGEKLRPVIETLDESARKVYLKRLQMCLDLFSYAIDIKEKN
jgi:hypothetical protein